MSVDDDDGRRFWPDPLDLWFTFTRREGNVRPTGAGRQIREQPRLEQTGTVRQVEGRPPVVFDPETGGTKRCETDDECENPERYRPPPCPPGQTRSGPGGRCAQPFTRARMPIPQMPTVIYEPVYQPRTSPAPSPADRLPRQRAARPARGIGGLLGGVYAWVLGTLVLGPYLGGDDWQPAPRSSGPPRRTRRPPGPSQDVPPFYRYEGPWPYTPGTALPGPIPMPSTRRTTAPGRNTRGIPAPRALPPRPRSMPRAQPTVSPVPAPAPWTLGDPLPELGYDPYTVAPPTPAPRRPAQPFPQPRAPAFPFPTGLPLSPRVGTRRTVRSTPRTLTSQPRRVQLPRQPSFTPNPNPSPLAFAQPMAQPASSNPCTAQREQRRRKQKACKKFTTKTIRVCADRS